MLGARVSLKRYEHEVQQYEQQAPEKGKILFYGDSSFTRWSAKWQHRSLEDVIRMKDGSVAAVNHGLGGSTVEEQLYYYSRMVRPWAPRALVSVSFGNDHFFGYSNAEILFLRSRLFDYARADMPEIQIYVCDVRPIIKYLGEEGSYARHVAEYNDMLREYCAKHDDCTYLCHTDSPLFFQNAADIGDYNKVRTDIYVEDKIHFNQKGYDLYTQFFLNALDEIL